MSLVANSDAAALSHEEFNKQLQEAIDLKNQERYEDAAAILEELGETNPASASVHGILGHVLWEQGKLPKAIRSFRQAVKISPGSELASLGLFHTLMDAGKKKAALQEMDRFSRVKKSAEYDAIAKEYGLQKPRQRHVYVDIPGVVIEGQRVSAIKKGLALNFEDATQRDIYDLTWRPDFGKLHARLAGDRKVVGSLSLWGELSDSDSLLKQQKRLKTWQVYPHAQVHGTDNAHAFMAYQIAKDLVRIDKEISEIILVVGDNEFIPVIEDLVAQAFDVTIAFWEHAASGIRNIAQFLPLDEWWEGITGKKGK